MKRFFALAAAVCFAGFPGATAAPVLVYATDAMQVQVYRLDNGLTVYLTRNAEAPRIYAEVVVRAGSTTDPADSTGLAHYLEHLMFKGTRRMGTLDYPKEKPLLDTITKLYEKHFREPDAEKRKLIYREINRVSKEAARFAVANDIDRIYKFIGGTGVNAHTSYEETVYKVDLPSNQLERWAVIEAERFSDPVFRLFHTELESVYEEKNTSLDDAYGQLYRGVQKLLFPGHPYGSQSVLGRADHLKKPSLVRIRRYFEKHYVPGNMAVIVSGDLVPEEAVRVIDRYFSRMPAKPVPRHQTAAPEPPKGVSRITLHHEGEESLIMGWRTVPGGHPDAYALEMLDMILDNSVAGLINLSLVQPQLVRAAGSYPAQLNEAGAQYLWGSPRDGQTLAQVEALLLEQVEKIKAGKFEDWLLPAIVSDLQSGHERSYESNQDRVEMVRDAYIARQPWAEASQYIPRMAAVTREDVVRVANKYFGKNYVVGHLKKGKPVVKHIEKPQIDAVPLNSSSESAFSKSVLALPVHALTPRFVQPGVDYRKTIGKNGVDYYTTENPVNDLFAITWTFPMGSLHDDSLPTLFDLLGKAGTDGLSAVELGKLWYQLGVTPEFSVYEDRTEIRLTGLSRSYKPAVKLLWQLLAGMRVEQPVLDKIVSDLKLARADAMDDPATIIHAMARYSRYRKNSKYIARMTAAELDRLTVDGLRQKLAHLLALPHQVSYIGKLGERDWRAAVPRPQTGGKAAALPERAVSTPGAPVEILFFHRDMAQARIWIESQLEGVTPEDLTVLSLFNEYFGGGMSSVVFQEIREARGLAYSASGYLATPRWSGDAHLAVGSVACQADKADDATARFLQLFDKLPESEVRFAESRDAMLNRLRARRSGFRNRAATAQYWQRRGIGFDPGKRAFGRIPDMTLSDMLEFYNQHVRARPKRVCILGDRNRMDLKALEKLGPVTEVAAGEIFTR